MAAGAQSGGAERSSAAPRSGADLAGDEALLEQTLRRIEKRRAALGLGSSSPEPPTEPDTLHRGTHREHTGTHSGTQEEHKDSQENLIGGADRTKTSGWRVRASEDEIREALKSCRVPTEDLGDFIRYAVERNREAFQRASEMKDEATGWGYRSQCWTFASIVKGHPDFADLEGWEVVRIADRYVDWDEDVPERDVFADEFAEDQLHPRDAFILACDVVQEPLSLTVPPANAMSLVNRWPLESECWPSPYDFNYRRLVSLCYWWARILDDDGRFFLSCRTAGALLGISHVQAATYLRRGTNPGEPLELLRKGEIVSGQASEYRFDFEAVTERAH